MKNKLTLVSWPNPNWKENPYQKLLTRALRRHGISVLPTPLFFSWLPYLRRFDWLHLFWTEQLYEAGDPGRRAEKLIRFKNVLMKLKQRGTRILWTMNNQYPHEADDKAFYKRAYSEIMALCDLVHVHFPAAVDYLQQEYGVPAEKVLVLPHGHYGDYYGKPIPKTEARRQLQIPDGAPVILNFGYLRKYKGIEDAVSAFQAAETSDLHFLIAGEPADPHIRHFLENEAQKNRRLLLHPEKIKEPELVRFFSAADAFVFPSKDFFTSGSIMLALTYNLPIIAVPHNHTLTFLGKSFFRPWHPATRKALTLIFDDLENWLKTVDFREMATTRQALDWQELVPKLIARLGQK